MYSQLAYPSYPKDCSDHSLLFLASPCTTEMSSKWDQPDRKLEGTHQVIPAIDMNSVAVQPSFKEAEGVLKLLIMLQQLRNQPVHFSTQLVCFLLLPLEQVFLEFTLQGHRYWSIFPQSQGTLPVTPKSQPASVVHPRWSRCCNCPWEKSSMGKNKVFRCFAPSHLSRHCQDASVLIRSFTVIAIDH